MMRFFRFILLAGVLLAAPLLRAQEDGDAVLDKYEQIALRCRDLRSRASGEVVARQEVTALLTELVRLRGILRQASGKMTPAQRERYARIRASLKARFGSATDGLKMGMGVVGVENDQPGLAGAADHQGSCEENQNTLAHCSSSFCFKARLMTTRPSLE